MSADRRPPDDGRRAELADNLAVLESRVRGACAAAGRDPAGLTTVVVTKTFPVTDVETLAELGVRDVGESRDQEARDKVAACARAAHGTAPTLLRWHFVGRLQTNKAGSVARYADVVHSVDRTRLVAALSRGAQAAGRTVRCLLQVSLDDDPARGGALVPDLPRLADAVAEAPGLELAGVMAVAPRDVDPRPAFDRLVQVSAEMRLRHPDATWVSAGMSGDLEEAVAAGATHLRVGGAVLGSRPPLG
ncbi:YggS family pyridoxal phosphate-dependent enzyme [Thalassiella azotivora]